MYFSGAIGMDWLTYTLSMCFMSFSESGSDLAPVGANESTSLQDKQNHISCC